MGASFKPGERVLIPVEVSVGAFPNESLVTFETEEGSTSGFVRADQLINVNKNKDRGYLTGHVVSSDAHVVAVMVRGSFFTTTGLTHFSGDWARTNIRRAEAVA